MHLRDIIRNANGPLTKALDKVKAVCTECGALDDWNAYEDYMLACLYNQADAYGHNQPIVFPRRFQKGALSITQRWESRSTIKALVFEIVGG